MNNLLNNTVIIYEGKSLLDNEPIVALATGFVKGDNTKLGANVIQVYIMRSDISPSDAIAVGKDKSVCGNCPLREKVCYVILGFAPRSIYRAYKKGSYSFVDNRHLETIKLFQKTLRLTAYGDVAAIPIEAVQPLIDVSSQTLGYTHQWRNDQRYKGRLMASCESEKDVLLAQSMGWQTFRIKQSGDPLLEFETHCTNQLHKQVQCSECGLCDGADHSIAIDVHGTTWKPRNFKQLVIQPS